MIERKMSLKLLKYYVFFTKQKKYFCRNGVGNAGLIAVLINECYRNKETGGQINLLESVQLMKQKDVGVIQSSVSRLVISVKSRCLKVHFV